MARPRRESAYDVLDDGTIRITLTGGTTAIIDPEDIALTTRCWGNRYGYAVRPNYNAKPRNVRMHRVVMARVSLFRL